MRVLVVGSCGNMGKRYICILKSFNIDVMECDLHNAEEVYNSDGKGIDKCIIATPIDSHITWCYWAADRGTPFLCEKPISKDLDKIIKLDNYCKQKNLDARMVCNWKFVIPGFMGQRATYINLDYFNTGKDGFYDFIQPIYFSSGNFKYNNKNPVYLCYVDNIPVNQYNFDVSYMVMLSQWLQNPFALWNLTDAVEAHKTLMEWKSKNEKMCSSSPGQIK